VPGKQPKGGKIPGKRPGGDGKKPKRKGRQAQYPVRPVKGTVMTDCPNKGRPGACALCGKKKEDPVHKKIPSSY
jgi:hypothetical protein